MEVPPQNSTSSELPHLDLVVLVLWWIVHTPLSFHLLSPPFLGIGGLEEVVLRRLLGGITRVLCKEGGLPLTGVFRGTGAGPPEIGTGAEATSRFPTLGLNSFSFFFGPGELLSDLSLLISTRGEKSFNPLLVLSLPGFILYKS